MKVDIVGIKNIEKTIERMGQVPIKHVSAAARMGMNKPLSKAKRDAPKDTGALRKGMKLIKESSKLWRYGKRVYRVGFDPKMNDVFQTINLKGENVGYYPISQEYGWITQSGNTVPAKHFITDAYNEKQEVIQSTITDEMAKRLTAEIKKGGLAK